MKVSNKSGLTIFAIIVALLALIFGFGMYYLYLNTSFVFIGLGIFSIILGWLILKKKEKLFLGDSNFKFFNNEKAWKKAYKVWAILWFFIGILFILNIFIDFDIGNIISIAVVIAVLITFIYMSKYKK